MNQHKLAHFALYLGAFCLALSPIFASLAQVNGFVATFYRVTVAAIALFIPFVWQQSRAVKPVIDLSWRDTIFFAGFGGTLFAFNNGFFNVAINMASASNAIFLINMAVVWVGLFSVFVFREKLPLNFWLGVGLALSGVLLIVNRTEDAPPGLLAGNLFALLGSLFYAAFILFNSRARQHLRALPYLFFISVASSILLFIIILFLDLTYFGFSSATYAYLVGLGLISHALGFISLIYAQGHIRPAQVSTILLAQPVITFILALVILREQPSALQFVGMSVLMVGIVLAARRR